MTTTHDRASKKWASFSVIATLLTLATSFTMLSYLPAHAAPVLFQDPVRGISHEVDDANPAAGATVSGYDPSVGGADDNIPVTVTHAGTAYSVTANGVEAFLFNTLTSVTIPDPVTIIGGWAFGYNALTHVTIPSSVTTIHNGAFDNNPHLSEVVFEADAPAIDATGNNGSFAQPLKELSLSTMEQPDSQCRSGRDTTP